MALKLGTTDASKVFVGTTPAKAVYLGNTLVWPVEWFNETWTYADQNTWGPKVTMWPGSGGLIKSGVPYMGVLGMNSGKALAAANVNAVATQDDMMVEWTHTSAAGRYGVATDTENVVCLRSNGATTQAGLSCVWLIMLTGQLGLAIVNNGVETNLEQNFNHTIPYGARLRFSTLGNAYTFTRLDTGQGLVFYNDAVQKGLRGPGSRRLMLGLTGNYPIFQQQFQSPTWDNMVWKPAIAYPSGATKSGTFQCSAANTWTLIPNAGWVFDPTRPGSAIEPTNGLRSQVTQTATVSVSLAYTGGTAGTRQIRLLRMGAVIATSGDLTTSPLTLSAPVALNCGDGVTVQVWDTVGGSAATRAVVQPGANTWLRIDP